MKKTINGEQYYLPSDLASEQKAIYVHIIDWKRKNITTERGMYKGHEYDAIFPNETTIPAMMYKPIIPLLEEMQQSDFAYKPHKFAYHAVSSQTACINLFMPLLLSENVDCILPMIPECPSDFSKIARDKLFRGFCFEYWGQDIKQGAGVLNDHSKRAGTDADVAIAYYNMEGKLCLWLIEHKLSEKEFTVCGAYKSKANRYKNNCTQCNLMSIAKKPQKCHYHMIGYKYWDILKKNLDRFQGSIEIKGCPFKDGLNQLWRNQVLAFALQETGIYSRVTFSVCHHAKNMMLDKSINQYKTLTNEDKMFSSFTNYDVLKAVNTLDSELQKWNQWYKDLYCF
ncbi:hypothetical protein [uncultured Coprobacter sp.]|uniref:PGN_0703 family putative restriction endonuclease n=1 Tax=uncultured Coprobacter sp. TaxID=1720550 RepID=UPI0026255496|nr:hypothetical protein [uncultured Coprobacter sp.]